MTLDTEDAEKTQAQILILSDISMAADTEDEAMITEPSTIKELLAVFQAASKMGEEVSMTLVSRDSKVMANFKLIESTEAGHQQPRQFKARRNQVQARSGGSKAKKEHMKKQKTTESVDILQCDAGLEHDAAKTTGSRCG